MILKLGMKSMTCQLIDYYIRNISIGKSCGKCVSEASPRPLLNVDK